METRDARTPSPHQLDELRSRAVALWKKGYNRRQVASLLDVHYNTVGLWISTFQIEGAGALRSAKRGRKQGDHRSLTAAQEKEVQKLIANRVSDQLKVAFALWTRRGIRGLVEIRFGVRLPQRTCGEYLKRWGFIAQRPARRNYNQNAVAVRRWIEKEYLALAARAKQEGAEIH